MSITISLCSGTDEWEYDPSSDCPYKHIHIAVGDRNVGPTIANLLNVIRSVYDDLLHGNECMDKLSEAYESITGQDIGY